MVTLDASLLCATPHEASLTIGKTSAVTFNYRQTTSAPDLAQYPRPIYVRDSLASNRLQIVMPQAPASEDATNIAGIVAKLGNLTGNRLPISVTLDIDPAQLLPPALNDHLMIVAPPERSKLLNQLQETVGLPASFHPRRLDLISRGPVAVSPASGFSYSFTATNTTSRDVNLSLIDALPRAAHLVDCSPACEQNPATGVISWTNTALPPGESAHFTLNLTLTAMISDNITLDNTATLLEETMGPVNAATLYSAVLPADRQTGAMQTSTGTESDYFFMYRGSAVAQNDGVIQTIPSPWQEGRAIIIVTGATPAAVKKASQALGSDANYPGMSGQVALVQNVVLPPLNEAPPQLPVQVSLEELGYQDVTLQGTNFTQEYRFPVPFGWSLETEPNFDIYFSHTQIMDFQNSGLSVILNRTPVASIPLSPATASDGHAQIKLPRTVLSPGSENRLIVTADIRSFEDSCSADTKKQWFLIRRDSKITFGNGRAEAVTLNLDNFPYPFSEQPTLGNVMLALPQTPTLANWEDAFTLIKILGDAAAGSNMFPAVKLAGEITDQELENYHIIAVGRPTGNKLLQSANAKLPQPFFPGSDEIQQIIDGVTFRLPPNLDLGLLQLIPSPWNPNRVFLAATGTTDKGVDQSLRTLIDHPSAMDFNLTLIQADSVDSVNAARVVKSGIASIVATVVPEAVAEPTPTPTPQPELAPTQILTSPIVAGSTPSGAAAINRPAWLLPFVAGIIIIITMIFAFAFWQARRPG